MANGCFFQGYIQGRKEDVVAFNKICSTKYNYNLKDDVKEKLKSLKDKAQIKKLLLDKNSYENYPEYEHFFRMFQFSHEDTEVENDEVRSFVTGECAWSVEHAMESVVAINIATGYGLTIDEVDEINQKMSKVTTLETFLKKHPTVKFEIISEELSNTFTEHYIGENGTYVSDCFEMKEEEIKEDEYKIVTDAPWIKVYPLLYDSGEIMEYVYDYIYTLF